jgi:hypothetical protein
MIHRLGPPARLVLVSDWTACDSLLIRRPKGTLSSDIQDRADQNKSLVRDRLPGHPHQLTPKLNTISGSPPFRKSWLNPCLASQLCCRDSQPPIPTFANRGHLKRTVPCVPNAVLIF